MTSLADGQSLSSATDDLIKDFIEILGLFQVLKCAAFLSVSVLGVGVVNELDLGYWFELPWIALGFYLPAYMLLLGAAWLAARSPVGRRVFASAPPIAGLLCGGAAAFIAG